MTIPLQKLVNDDQWEAEEDLAGRLGIVAHAAFLRAGFVPYGNEPSSGHLLKQLDAIGSSAPRLSRRYTAAQLAVRGEGNADVDVAVLELRARGNGDVAFQAYLLTSDSGRRRLSCEAVLDEAALAPLLCCCLGDVARALETSSAGAWLWKSLADWVVPALFLELCRRNDLPVAGFASLLDDGKVEILKRLTDGKDLAKVECASRQLRRLVAERDGELWKAMYESLGLLPVAQSSESETEGLGSWKKRYMEARRRLDWRRLWAWPFNSSDDDDDGGWLARYRRRLEAILERRRQREADLQRPLWVPRVNIFIAEPEPMEFTGFVGYYRPRQQEAADLQRRQVRRGNPSVVAPMQSAYYLPPYMGHYRPAPAPEQEVAARGKNAGRQHQKLQQNDYQKKRHGAGAIHSPSSRYKWKHR